MIILLGMKFEKIFNRTSFSFTTFKFGQVIPPRVSCQRNLSIPFLIESISALL